MEFVRGVIHTVTSSFSRPNDTNTYAAGDVVCNSTASPAILKFPGAAKDQRGHGMIRGATLIDEANVATKADLQLWLFDTAPAAVNDNAAFAPSDSELEACVGVIAFPTGSFVIGLSGSGASGNAVCDAQGLAIPFSTVINDNALYGVLVVRNAYVPIATEKFVIRLKIED
jgi:hypothetical protein